MNPRARDDERFPAFCRDGAGGWAWRWPSTWPCKARRTIPYVKGHPGWFYQQERRDDKGMRRTRRRSTWTCTRFGFEGRERDASSGEEILRLILFWVDKGSQDVPCRQPAHETSRVLGVADQPGEGETPRPDLPSGGVRAPQAHEAACQAAGSNQSYTYFTWKNTQTGAQRVPRGVRHLRSVESTSPGTTRPNTPDILSAYLQHGGRNAFKVRLVLAATLSSVYGIYSGFELCKNTAVEEGSRSASTGRSTSTRSGTGTDPGT